jgi:integrase/recombinase XerD
MAGLPHQPKPKRIPRAIAKERLQRLFETMEAEGDRGNLLGLRDHALFRLIYDAGLRCSEAALLQMGDLELAENAATVHGKGGDMRIVYGWLDVLHPGSSWIFVSLQVTRGLRPLTRNGIHQALHRWCDRAGIAHFRVHDLRHSYARHALRAGIDLEMVSRQLGHHDPGFTLEVYGRSEDRERREVHLRLSPGDHLEG